MNVITHVDVHNTDTGERRRVRVVAVAAKNVSVRIDGVEYTFSRRHGQSYDPDCVWYMPTGELAKFAVQNKEAMRGNREVF